MTSCNTKPTHNCPQCGSVSILHPEVEEAGSKCNTCEAIYHGNSVVPDRAQAGPVDLMNDLVETAFNNIFRK